MVSVVIFTLLVFLIYRLISRIGQGIPILELTALLYVLQYCVAAWLVYRLDPYNLMAIDEQEYLIMSVSSCIAFFAGFFIIKNESKISIDQISPVFASKLGRILVVIGLFSNLASLVLPESLLSVLNFFILFKIIGTYALVFSNNKMDRTILIVVTLQIGFSAIINALLIEFIVFSVFLFFFISLKYKISNQLKIGLFVAGLFFLTVYQGVKKEFRTMTWTATLSPTEKLVILSGLISFDSFTTLFDTEIEDNSSVLSTIHRLNQGWQTGMVYAYVPEFTTYENGKDFMNDILSSVLPRFLLPDKRMVNDPDRFEKYTGYPLNSITSMSIGVFGDFYINFGFYGSLIALFLFGYVMAWFIRLLGSSFIGNNQLNIIWLPFIFSYFIRPGNEFYMVLNHIIKALIVLAFITALVYPYLKTVTANSNLSESE